MGKTRDLFKKIGDIRELFHARMGTIKDRNCKDLTEAEEIKKRWQEQAEDLYKTDSDKHDSMAHDSSRARHSGVGSQVGLRKHYYNESQ